MENNYHQTSKYIYILINNDTLTFVTNKEEELATTIVDIKNNFGNSIFPNIEVEVTDSLTIPIKKNGVIIENYENLMTDSNLKKELFEEKKSNFISIEEAKRYFSGLGSESIFMDIEGVRVPIYYNGLKIDLKPGWENNIGKYHPDAISLKLYGEAMDKYEEEFEPKIMN